MKKYIIPFLVLFLAAFVVFVEYHLGSAIPGFTLAIAGGFPLIKAEFDGDSNLPGIARGYLIKTSDISNEATPIANPTTGKERITISGSHQLASQKYWVESYSTQGKGTLAFTAEGGRDFENFKISGTLFLPCTKEDYLALSTALLGQDLIVILEQNSDEDFFLQVGTKKLPARVVPSGDWGTELNGEKGITLTIDAFHGKATPYIYRGVIPLSNSIIVS